MKFTILSHAGMLIEAGAVRLVTDPWLLGSCYWRSWWHYPPPPEPLIRQLNATHIYITHLHWDHFQGPSLRKLFARDIKVLVPKATFPRMVHDLRSIGFLNVQEIPHGASLDLGDLKVTSYQFGVPLDSCLVATDGKTTLVDANDCKLMGGPLRQLRRRHPRVDFVFRSHSSANPFPHCLRTDNPEWLRVREKEDYMEEFLAFAEVLGARYAIPFASNHCFLHRETLRFNETVVSPLMVKEHFDAHKQGDSACVVMIPGDWWDDCEGFHLQEHDYFTDRDKHLAALQAQHAAKLEAYYALEKTYEEKLPWKGFRMYFERLLHALPLGFSRICGIRVVFRVLGKQPQHWLVDFRRRVVEDHKDTCPPCAFVVEMHPIVLRDCAGKKMFGGCSASKRLVFEIRDGTLEDVFKYDLVVGLYESDHFPIRKLLGPRFVSGWVRRWREALLYTRALFDLKVRRRPPVPADLIRTARGWRRRNGALPRAEVVSSGTTVASS
jgi:UDP-MurNAc hydroxylase